MLPNTVVTIARSYIGQDEIPPNRGFKDPVFDGKMRAVGFINSYAWCALLAKLIWLEAAAGEKTLQASIRRLCGPSVLGTYNACKNSGLFIVNKIPAPGALVVWKHGTDPHDFTGHMGICTVGGLQNFSSVEGNTSPTDPNERNGGTTAEKLHHLNLPPNPKGLNLVAFIHCL